MKYPEWWERLVAAIIDGVILAIVFFIINAILIGIAGFNYSMIVVMALIATLLNTAIAVAYKVIFEGGKLQATPGKMVFGLKVADDAGGRLPMQRVFMRTWPWWLNLISIIGALIGVSGLFSFLVAIALIAIFFTFFMEPIGRCLHDQTANAHVVKGGKGMIQTGQSG